VAAEVSASDPALHAPDIPRLAPQSRLAHYQVIEHIGHGGSAEVYAARDRFTGGLVAIKLQTRSDHRSARARFLREYQVLSAFRCAHLPRVHQLGELPDGRVYLVMEHLDSVSVRHHLKPYLASQSPAHVAQVIALATQLADTLSLLHAQGIIHGDVKPSNVRVSRDGTGHAWLLDLGGARDTEAETPWIKPHHFFGTYHYAAPEQLDGIPDARADIYSLGVMLHDLISGAHLFDASDRAGAKAQRRERAPLPLCPRVPHASEALSDLVQAMLAVDPADRPSDASKIAATLRRLQPSPRHRVPPPALTVAQAPPQPSPSASPAASPSPWPAALALGRAQRAAGHLTEAAETLSRALTSLSPDDPTHALILEPLADTWRQLGHLSQAQDALRAALYALPQARHPVAYARLLLSLAEVHVHLDRLGLVEHTLTSLPPASLLDPDLRSRALILRARIALAFQQDLPTQAADLMEAVLQAKQAQSPLRAARSLAWCAVTRAALQWPSAAEMAHEAVAALLHLGDLPLLAEASICRVHVLNSHDQRPPLPTPVAAWLARPEPVTHRIDYYLAVAARTPTQDAAPISLAYQQVHAMWPALSHSDRWALKLIPWIARCDAERAQAQHPPSPSTPPSD
jgi:tRNA A-37 threonylcarbamoyl transferase component Bud32/tetratricopeptide (TPR) repeat protein